MAQGPTMKTLKALSALLTYPTRELIEALPELHAVIVDEALVDRASRDGLKALMRWMEGQDLLDLEGEFVAQFDRGRATCLHLFEHVHGDSRDRGQAMVDLKRVYERAGFRLAGHELPDFIPAVLEFLSTRQRAEIDEMLDDCAHILRTIGEALRDRASPYAAVFAALLSVIHAPGLGAGRPAAAQPEKSLDEEWAEEPVIFGPAAAPGCGQTPRAQPMHFVRARPPRTSGERAGVMGEGATARASKE
jgi:nitrate reductase delta subunit